MGVKRTCAEAQSGVPRYGWQGPKDIHGRRADGEDENEGDRWAAVPKRSNICPENVCQRVRHVLLLADTVSQP